MKFAITILTALFFLGTSHSFGADINGVIPDEYESTAGHSLGLGNAGVVAAGGLSSVRLNPAMLSLEKQYRVSGGYHWPSEGRAFYQAGIVDSTTSSIAAGVIYTSSQEDFKRFDPNETASPLIEDAVEDSSEIVSPYDTPITKRVSVGAAGKLKSLALGINGQHLEATSSTGSVVKGQTFGFGIAGLLSPTIRFGASVENLGNKKISDYAPRFYRAGVALITLAGQLTLHLDYRDRARVRLEGIEQKVDSEGALSLRQTAKSEDLDSEKMVIPSASIKIYDVLRFLAAYGAEVGGEKRETLSGGIALVNNTFALSYLVSQPYSDSELHQAINFGFEMGM